MLTETLRPLLRRSARIASWTLSLLAIGFFFRLVVRHGMAMPGRDPLEIASISLVCSVVYGLAVALLSFLWPLLAIPANCSDSHAAIMPVASSYMKSQFAKYLPGNVFQYAARHALGRQLGIPHGHLAAAAVVEAAMLIGAASFLVLALGKQVLSEAGISPPLRSLALLIPLLAVLAAGTPRPRFLQWIPRYSAGRTLLAFAGYTLFFAIFGCIFTALMGWTSQAPPDPLRTLPASSLAWLVGFLVPGAPAGAGLREAALALADGGGSPSQTTLAAIMMFRIATMGGDFFAFALGWMVSRNSLPSA